MYLRKQHGAVLMVSLVMLLLMTILGLTAMSSATMEQKMAANSQDINTTLQASESATRAVLGDLSVLGAAMTSNTPVTADIKLDSNYSLSNQPVQSNASVVYLGSSPLDGFSLGVTSQGFAAHHFEITGTGTMSGNIRTQTVQGMFRVGAAQ